MPLSNKIISKLNEISTMVQDKNHLDVSEIYMIKGIFQKILDEGERYEVEEIEAWLENEGTWNNKSSRIRITNISHYIQDKYEQNFKFRIIESNKDSCSCGN